MRVVTAAALTASALAILAASNAAYAQQATASGEAAGEAAGGGATDASAPTTEDIVVTGFRKSLQQGIELKREAVGVRDSIVAEDIGKFPEANVADSLQRIPGVFLSRDGASNEGQRISIRGLGSEFTVTTINGAPVHTTSSQNVGSSTRDFNYDVFPSELFGRVDVYKSPLANLEEGGIGGNVDLQTPRPFDSAGRVIRYTAQGNYNTQSKKWQPRGSLLFSDTWGDFGVLLGAAYAKNVNERSGFQSTGGYNSSAIGSLAYQGPTTVGGPFQFQMDLDNPLANFGDLTRDEINNAYLPRFYRVFTSNNTRERIGLVGSIQYKTDRLDVSVDGIFSELKDQADEFTFGAAVRNSRTVAGTTNAPGVGTNSGIIPLDVHIDEFNNLYGTFGNTSFIQESFFRNARTRFKYGIVRAVYDLTDNLKLSAQGNLSDSNARYTANRITSNIYGITSTFDPTVNVTYPTISSPVDFTDPANFTAPGLGFSLNREIDKEKTARAVLDWKPVDDGDRTFAIKLGGSYVDTGKQISQQDGSSIASAQLAGLDVFSYMDPYIQFGRIRDGGNSGYPSQFATFPRSFVMDVLDANAANAAAPVNLNGAFKANEIVKTGFFEANFTLPVFGRELRGNVGMRYSNTSTIIHNYQSAGSGVFVPQRREGGYDNWLPSASLAYDVTDKVVLRASAGKTITRAALTAIAGGTIVPNVFNADVTVGNPNLRPQMATQFDAGVEWYFAPGGLLSIGAFKKDIVDRAMAVQDFVTFGSLGLPDTAFNAVALGYPDGDIPDDFLIRRTQYVNQGQLKLKGLEFAYQQNFTFLPKPFDGLGFTGSLTLIDQKGDDFVTTEGTRVPIQFVPKYSYSATAFYEKGPFAVRASYNYRAKTGITSQNTGNDQIPYTAPQGFLDGTISYKLNDMIELRIDALNITNENVYIFYSDPDGPKGNGKSRRDNSFFNGTTVSFGVRGKF
ncbi:TonB-dependent receptor [Novosphingobium sp. BL-8A]|uniref:TonB-dependent receptor n=1 Tax=Novosphingobium sp. BL-8A TaxID=3127639 RepID=UPI00375710B6